LSLMRFRLGHIPSVLKTHLQHLVIEDEVI
jgi:hypothetical protein